MLAHGDIEVVNLSTGELKHRVTGDGESRLESNKRHGEPSEDDLTSEYDYQAWRESWRRAYGYYPNQAATLEEFDPLPQPPHKDRCVDCGMMTVGIHRDPVTCETCEEKRRYEEYVPHSVWQEFADEREKRTTWRRDRTGTPGNMTNEEYCFLEGFKRGARHHALSQRPRSEERR